MSRAGVARQRRGSWFDPPIADAFLSVAGDAHVSEIE